MMTDTVTRAPATSDITDAVATLLVAGAAHGAVDALSPEGRQVARTYWRSLSIQGANQLAAAVGATPPYAVGGEIDPRPCADAIKWLATASDRAGGEQPIDHQRIELWLFRTVTLLRGVAAGSDARSPTVARTLIRSVIRPLCEALAGAVGLDHLDEQSLRVIASRVLTDIADSVNVETELVSLEILLSAAADARNPSLVEAAAALARLVAMGPLAEDASFTVRAAAVANKPPLLAVASDGPYLLEGAARVVDHLGVPVSVAGRAAFCRCGQSASKPFCDGSHAGLGFSDDKDPHRIADQRDAYVGQQATVFDNRGLCAHSGFCTDRLKSVFHVGQEPFVTPSGGRLDDIMRAVRHCPSGALSFGVEGREMRGYVDEARPPEIEISKDGPYRITGNIAVVDAHGGLVPRNEGGSFEHYSLCRCGSSLNKPFCSGMHWSVNFADPRPPEDWEPTLFEWAGGYPALLEMTRLFYSRHVPSDPIVGPLFATMEADHPERVAAWLSEVFGGPKYYSERYGGYTRMISQHLDKHLTQEQRSHWATLMAQSADEAGLPNDAEFRAAFMGYIEWGSRIAVENSTAGAKPPSNMPMPSWWWVCNAMPFGRISALAPVEEEPTTVEIPVLADGERPSFAKHIKDLFRPIDRNSMKFAFDLWSYEDVRANADAILGRVKAGTMPCDKAWRPEKVLLFQMWIEGGTDA